MQVILSPVDSVANTYHALLPEGTPLEFQRILDLKVCALKLDLLSVQPPIRFVNLAQLFYRRA
jgi:hypothetical protein